MSPAGLSPLCIPRLSVHPILLPLADYLHLFLRSHMPSCIFQRLLHRFRKVLSGSPAGGHFQRRALRRVFFCIIVFHISCDSFSFADDSFLNDKRKSQFQIHPRTWCVDCICFYWLDIWIMMESSQTCELMRPGCLPGSDNLARVPMDSSAPLSFHLTLWVCGTCLTVCSYWDASFLRHWLRLFIFGDYSLKNALNPTLPVHFLELVSK